MEAIKKKVQSSLTSLTKRKDSISLETSTIKITDIIPESGVNLFDVLKSDLDENDFLMFLKFMATKFRTKDFYNEKSAEWNLAHLTFRMAKEKGFTKEYFKKRLDEFIISYLYPVDHWQPDDILKLAEQPRLYPRSWVMSKMKDDPHVWEKLAMYELGDHVLYAWKWEDVPLKRFVPKQARPDYSSHQPEAETQDISDEEPSKLFEAVRENLKLKIKIDEMERESREFARRITGLQELVEQLRGNGGGIE